MSALIGAAMALVCISMAMLNPIGSVFFFACMGLALVCLIIAILGLVEG